MTNARIAITAFVCTTTACALLLDLQPPPEGGVPDASSDAPLDGATDATVTCTPLDAALPNDDAGTSFRPLFQAYVDDAGTYAYNYYDLSQLASGVGTFEGATSDGTHLYLAPANPGGAVLQYTLGKSLSQSTSWKEFTPTNLGDAGTVGFSGALFDGRYVYFVPHESNATTPSGVVLRYDTKANAFTSASSWSTFDTQTLPVPDGGVPARGFSGGTFDGRFLYFAPNFGSSTAPNGRAARFDTQGGVLDASADAALDAAVPTPFTTLANWSTFDTAAVNADAVGFTGAVFDGHYVYFVPYANSNGFSGYIARYDTTVPFTTGWSTYGVAPKDANAVGFVGGAFDGRYVYFVPHHATIVVRLDTQATFGSSGTYTLYDLAPIFHADAGVPSFAGAAFDGRFVYFVPSGAGFAMLTRYDTLSPFGDTCAWSTFDVSKSNSLATDFFGAVYDGRYLYLVPHGSVIVRFDTKTPAWTPALPLGGSLY